MLRTNLIAVSIVYWLAATAHAAEVEAPFVTMFRGDPSHTGSASEPGLVGLELA